MWKGSPAFAVLNEEKYLKRCCWTGYNEAVAKAMGMPFDQPTEFTLTDWAENVTVNGESVE